jgi:membrane-associated phospholipid phosphatase
MYLSPFEDRLRLRRRLMLLAGAMLLMMIATLADRWFFLWAYVGRDRRVLLEQRDWMQLARIVGYLPSWMVLWAGVVLASASRLRWRDRAAASLVLAPLVSGLLAEVVKRLISRERPVGHETVAGHFDGGYVFKPVLGGFLDSSNLGIPSSHAAVAWAGAFAAIALWPRAWPVFTLLALACSWHRLVTGSHFLSDVALGLILGWCAWRLVRPGGWHGPAGPRWLP